MTDEKNEILSILHEILESQKQTLEELREIRQMFRPRVSDAKPERIEVEPCVPGHLLHNVDPEAEKLWESICEKVKERISKPSYETWFKSTTAYRIEGDRLLVWAPNHFAADWLTTRYSELVHALLPEGDVKRIRFAWMDFQPDQD